MSKGLYSRDEISVMTDSGLDELLGYYSDSGNAEGVQRVRDEMADREDERAAEAEAAYEQELHDEMMAATPMAWEG